MSNEDNTGTPSLWRSSVMIPRVQPSATGSRPRKLRVALRVDEDNRTHVLVSIDGVKIAESSTDGDTLALEVDV